MLIPGDMSNILISQMTLPMKMINQLIMMLNQLQDLVIFLHVALTWPFVLRDDAHHANSQCLEWSPPGRVPPPMKF